jgi:hypothetical protein
MIDLSIRRRFEEMVPWYVNGSLEPESRRWFETQLAAHPELHAELRLTEALQAQVRAAIPDVAPELGMDKLMRRIHAEREQTQQLEQPLAQPSRQPPSQPRRAASPPTLWQRISLFFERCNMTPAFAAAAAVIAIQAGVIGTLLMVESGADPEYSTFRSAGDGLIVAGPLIEVAFSAEAREREIRELLVRIGGTLAGGPGQLGNYMIYVPAERVEEATRILESAPVVEAVTVIPEPSPGC